MNHFIIICLTLLISNFSNASEKKNMGTHVESDHNVTPISTIKAKKEKKKKKVHNNKKRKKERLLNKKTKFRKISSSGDENCEDLTRDEIIAADEIINRLGGVLVDPRRYPETVEGLQEFIDDVGVNTNSFSAEEMVEPNHKVEARQCGFEKLLPNRCRWITAAALGMIASKFRERVNDPIVIRNWWRPTCYNNKPIVAGEINSDHLQARGMDLDFASDRQRAKAQKWLCDFYRDEPFQLQTGIGARTLHIGMSSPRGVRYWTYPSLLESNIKRRIRGDTCWTATPTNKNDGKVIYSYRAQRGF